MAEEQPKMTRVTAPSDLEAGYTFEASVDGIDFTVTVPEGGVVAGQEFEVPYPSGDDVKDKDDAPKGAFKNGLCSCFEVFCNGLFWMSWCCDPLLFGQLMSRFTLDGCAKATSRQDAASTFGMVAFVYVIFLVACCFGVGIIFLPFFIVYMWIIRTRTRGVVRSKYDIETGKCGACEDFCCAVFCHCCTGIQIARHTHDEEQYPYQCCAATGLPGDAPAIE